VLWKTVLRFWPVETPCQARRQWPRGVAYRKVALQSDRACRHTSAFAAHQTQTTLAFMQFRERESSVANSADSPACGLASHQHLVRAAKPPEPQHLLQHSTASPALSTWLGFQQAIRCCPAQYW
jgi:hypothetical protein